MTKPPNTPQTAPEEELKPYFKLPFRYDPEGQYIFDAENNMIADIRAWGHLKDERLQDALGELIAKAVNDAWNSRPLFPLEGKCRVCSGIGEYHEPLCVNDHKNTRPSLPEGGEGERKTEHVIKLVNDFGSDEANKLTHELAEIRSTILSRFKDDGTDPFYEEWLIKTVESPYAILAMLKAFLPLPRRRGGGS